MDISRKRRRVAKAIVDGLAELYPHDVQLYRKPPLMTISLSEFEELAVARLKVLRIIDQANLQKNVPKYSEDWRKKIIADVKKQGIKTFPRLAEFSEGGGQSEEDVGARRKDHISHYLLRLAYCRSEDLRRWFIAREVDLFRLRFHCLTPKGITTFLKENKLDYSPIHSSEKEELKEHLRCSTASISSSTVDTFDFYKVPFIEVLDLVRNRKVYLSSGFAYIPSPDLVSVLMSLFRANLSHALTLTFRHLAVVEQDERIYPLLRGLHHSYTGEEYLAKKDGDDIQVEDLDKLSRSSFPLCMRRLHEKLREAHHLKYGGRMQYGLFLKGIGLSLENAMKFWREEFVKAMDADKFEKQYAYNIRHNYGKEGKRVNYTPYSCTKIIMSSVGPGDTHGCPFKHNDLSSLKQQLLSIGIPSAGIQEISDYVSRGHYQIACGKYFEITHNASIDSGVNHPNKYFEESQKLIAGKHFKSENGESLKPASKAKPKEDIWGDDIVMTSLELTKIEAGIKTEPNESDCAPIMS